jgi:hypothetical protein
VTASTPTRAVVPARLLRGAWSPDVAKIIIGLVLIGLVLLGQDLVGWATSAGRLDPALRDASAPRNVVVVLDFTPERFHSERLAQYGVFAGRDGAVNRVRLRMVSPDDLRRLARLIWVARVEPLR